jgi:hypothetical protein
MSRVASARVARAAAGRHIPTSAATWCGCGVASSRRKIRRIPAISVIAINSGSLAMPAVPSPPCSGKRTSAGAVAMSALCGHSASSRHSMSQPEGVALDVRCSVRVLSGNPGFLFGRRDKLKCVRMLRKSFSRPSSSFSSRLPKGQQADYLAGVSGTAFCDTCASCRRRVASSNHS